MQAAACHSGIAAEEESDSPELKIRRIYSSILEFTTWNPILTNQERLLHAIAG